jgi:hypothetical protein
MDSMVFGAKLGGRHAFGKSLSLGCGTVLFGMSELQCMVVHQTSTCLITTADIKRPKAPGTGEASETIGRLGCRIMSAH